MGAFLVKGLISPSFLAKICLKYEARKTRKNYIFDFESFAPELFSMGYRYRHYFTEENTSILPSQNVFWLKFLGFVVSIAEGSRTKFNQDIVFQSAILATIFDNISEYFLNFLFLLFPSRNIDSSSLRAISVTRVDNHHGHPGLRGNCSEKLA